MGGINDGSNISIIWKTTYFAPLCYINKYTKGCIRDATNKMAVYQLNSANFVDIYIKFYCFFNKKTIQFTRNLRFTWYYHLQCCSIPLLQDTLWGIRLLHYFKKSRCTFHVNGNRKSLEEYCFSYQVSTHLPYLSKTTINVRETLSKLSFSQYRWMNYLKIIRAAALTFILAAWLDWNTHRERYPISFLTDPLTHPPTLPHYRPALHHQCKF